MAGCVLLMMYYTTVSGWMVDYFFRFLTGSFDGLTSEQAAGVFGEMLSNPVEMVFWMVVITLAGFVVCGRGLQGGLEKVGKWMMSALLVLILVLVVHSFTLSGAGTRRTTPNRSHFMAPHRAAQPSATASIPFQVVLNTRGVFASSMDAA